MFLRKTMLAGLVGAAAALGLTFQSAAQVPGVTDDEIKIGLFMPLSGPLAAFGVDPTYAAKMYYDQINAAGGIHGRKINLLIEDDKCDTNETLSIIKKYVSIDNVFLLHGGACTAGAQAAKEYVTREQVPLVVLNAGADGGVFPPSRYFFAGSLGTQASTGGAIMDFAVNGLKGKKIGVMVQDDDIGTANLRGAKSVADEAGAELVAVERVAPKATDMTAPMLNIRAANPDVIVAILYPAPSALATQKYGEFGMTQPIIAGVQSVQNPEVYAKNVGNNAALENFYYATPLKAREDLKELMDQYKAAYPEREPGAWVPFGIPSAMAIVKALEAAGPDLTREKFIDAMEGLSFESGVLVGPTEYSAERHDGFRSLGFIKFDGTDSERQEGTFTWNGKSVD